jgi:hypothetical protein
LEDIETGLSFDGIKRRFDEKMHPLQYLRPTAPPSAGNIAQTEKLVAQLETAGALARRFARLDEVDALWRPEHLKREPTRDGVFGHLRTAVPHRQTHQVLPPVTMTWVKFRNSVLPNAASIEYYVHHGVASYTAIVTAVNADAPPLLQWDRPERRNPASWYLYHGGSRPGRWNLRSGEWAKVNAFTLRPCQWYGNEVTKEDNAVLAVLNDARDTDHRHGGGFFPENLRSEYHGVRKTLEAYAQAATIEGREQASACGIMLQGGVNWVGMMFRVTSTTGTVATYNLDRWD